MAIEDCSDQARQGRVLEPVMNDRAAAFQGSESHEVAVLFLVEIGD